MVDGSNDTFLVRVQKSEIILPGQYLDIKIPRDNPPSQTFAVEDRQCGFLENPLVLESVGYNIRIPNKLTK